MLDIWSAQVAVYVARYCDGKTTPDQGASSTTLARPRGGETTEMRPPRAVVVGSINERRDARKRTRRPVVGVSGTRAVHFSNSVGSRSDLVWSLHEAVCQDNLKFFDLYIMN
ncbi:hypothetical protein QE152_g19729 [Popillia japonica]|uniref:Uncharacterized protein n=1 Tax=Popillia japonica TaxID=7064 RepID=A0AAW1KQC8_POPJA